MPIDECEAVDDPEDVPLAVAVPEEELLGLMELDGDAVADPANGLNQCDLLAVIHLAP